MIAFENVAKTYPDGTVAVENLSFTAPAGKLTVFVGPSGCGKTTMMRMINRLADPTAGRILIDGASTVDTDRVTLRRKIGYVIQGAGLFPHRTALDNVAALPQLLGTSKKEARSAARELLARVGLTDTDSKKYPWQLSGGQQQRVGVARALATDPPYLLMDEPFSAVDPIVRAQLQEEFLRLQRELSKTIVMVTHDIDEALKLGDYVAVMQKGGHLAQFATPAELLTRPANDFVADFVGSGRGYRALQFLRGGVRIQPEQTVTVGSPAPRIPADDATSWSLVVDAAGRPLGWLDRSQSDRASVELGHVEVGGTLARHDGNLREILDAALTSPVGRAVIVDDEGRLEGTVALATVVEVLESSRAAER